MDELVLICVTVEGSQAFPIDMLRYDGLHPRQETDANCITRSITNDCEGVFGELYKVQLSRMAEPSWQPKSERWHRKFGWRVLSVEVLP